jgi:hypothetical protein
MVPLEPQKLTNFEYIGQLLYRSTVSAKIGNSYRANRQHNHAFVRTRQAVDGNVYGLTATRKRVTLS